MEIFDTVSKYADEGLVSIILSNSRDSGVQKEKIRPVILKNKLCFQAETFKGQQVFHENLEPKDLAGHVKEALLNTFKQGELRHRDATLNILVSKKGTVTVKEKRVNAELPAWQPLCVPASHNRQKNYLLPEGTAIPFMQDLGVFTADGTVVKSRMDKYRQINRFLEFIDDIVPSLPADKTLNILDFGCGKSYLTFAVYYFLTALRGRKVKITGIDLKKDVVENCERLARRYGYDGLSFRCGDVSEFEGAEDIDMMMTLHACDTATDYALSYAVKAGARVILSVPCCQHELNAQFKDTALSPLFRYGIVKERVAALATDALRAELLEANGYKVQLLEFIDMEHTPKNILIRAVKRTECQKGRFEGREDGESGVWPCASCKHKKHCAEASKRVGAFVCEYGLQPTLYKLLSL